MKIVRAKADVGPHPAVAAVRGAVRAALASGGSSWTGEGVPAPSPEDHARPVLVACSGGADSLALAAATAFVAPRAGIRAGLVTVDHGLQPGSADIAARVATLGYELGLDPVHCVRVDVGTGGGPEAAARAARYAALAGVAAPLGAQVLLAHTLDDQAETVLLGLGRGSGPRSIAGMAGADPPYLRPFLGLRRADTVAACRALGLEVWDDPHNLDPRYQRVRLRRDVLPLLDEVLQGGTAAALARTADLLRDDLEALDAWADSVMISVAAADNRGPGRDHHHTTLDAVALAELPRAVRTRVLRRWATAPTTEPLSAERTAALDSLVTDWHGQGAVDLPGGATVRRSSGRLVRDSRPHLEKRV